MGCTTSSSQSKINDSSVNKVPFHSEPSGGSLMGSEPVGMELTQTSNCRAVLNSCGKAVHTLRNRTSGTADTGYHSICNSISHARLEASPPSSKPQSDSSAPVTSQCTAFHGFRAGHHEAQGEGQTTDVLRYAPRSLLVKRESSRRRSSEQGSFFHGRSFSLPSDMHGTMSSEWDYALAAVPEWRPGLEAQGHGLRMEFLLASSRRSCGGPFERGHGVGWYHVDLATDDAISEAGEAKEYCEK